MTDYTELKRLAEAAKAEEVRVIQLAASGDGWEALPDQASFRCVASPEAVLSMIAENDRLQRAEKNDATAYMASIDRQEEIRVDRDEVRAENEALRKDLESHKRMLLAAACDLGAIGEALKSDMDDDGDALLGMVIDLKAQNTRMLEWLKDISRTSGDKGAVMGARQLLKEFAE
ncbi:hypothetical protein GIW77_24360 [Pseudomonas simiae]|uniref:Ead/Ea22-like family protein n=1 Tax=Pseudomonas simiae TaxID=321846 RepID=A0ABS9G4M6_9PSED|nr:hypothetical protein [Pseudomonas simiae]MCF5049328.1 hypothetical protein [Pseudomonas simiae]MCF5188063.1 hypothetical protein [Pseudomonas simiae]MCF5286943.1 hypothetical protein [Pseudomonas simiae]MCF5319989.1 hypothetical protein [Pseudomonas simiae]MCF5336883.1 hypothetical protein [Pseudomonas simiae]